MIVYVVKYTHEYGQDLWVQRTEQEALESVSEIILDWVEGEVPRDVAIAICELIAEGKHGEALVLYEDNCDERFDISNPVDLDKMKVIAGVQEAAAALAADLRRQEDEEDDGPPCDYDDMSSYDPEAGDW